MRFLFLNSLIALLIFSCTKKQAPEDVLRKYVDYRFSASQTRDGAIEMLTGELKEKLKSLSEEELKIFLNSTNMTKKSLSIQSSNCSGDKCKIVYILKYEKSDQGKKPYVVENKKEAVLAKEEDSWKVSEVSNIKTYIESPEIGISSKSGSKSEGEDL
ncbi:MAG: hypothetical protein COW00_05515 [Bdellovibrio sp. CG12_big_fil_rev_8_21_14_0_65_39_13]|nr:MAG: hypothetical protein COW78_18050 [Bdellovibrio sp. CG22_combo_CG10-13_8_21_14_all_39_27]PIQ60690.1 MAG: hypothetical protein COW00_05515 [Bdellovibrio sp. CG12_big_fil_rev_8_21_14_0_65_39_13]PIR37074.1 MAG: hypothetical protein COV37_00875 [Bdellovibrio sp. CG11_big_fil_rev_8_21_14_0_20_39_38]